MADVIDSFREKPNLFQGPALFLDRFVGDAIELKTDAYWEVLDKLVSEKGK